MGYAQPKFSEQLHTGRVVWCTGNYFLIARFHRLFAIVFRWVRISLKFHCIVLYSAAENQSPASLLLGMIGDEEPEPPDQWSGDTAARVDNRQDESTVQEPHDVQAFVPHRHRICTLVHNK